MKTVELVKNKIKQNKKHNEEGEVILKGLREGLDDFSEEDKLLNGNVESKNFYDKTVG